MVGLLCNLYTSVFNSMINILIFRCADPKTDTILPTVRTTKKLVAFD